jgi:enoyl-CoA hydratase
VDTTRIELSVERGLARITLDGPRTRNALEPVSAAALVEACDAVDADESVGVLVITGAGGAFCSGAVRGFLLGIGEQPPSVGYELMGSVYAAFERVGRMAVPTLARIEGGAVGAGLNLALATDLRIAADDALLRSGFARLGVHPGGGHLHLLERAANRQVAAALGVFAQELTGRQAKERGLVWDAVPAAELDAVVEAACASLRDDPALARALKRSLELTTAPAERWAAASEVERARQLWSLGRVAPARV